MVQLEEAMQKAKEIRVPTAPPTTEPNKGRQLPALETSSLSTCLGASRDLYAQSPPGTLTTLNAKPQRVTLSLDPLEQTSQMDGIPAD
ncbi:hypothetical protein AVEN_89771-1 [Araneus ventricosus]|uniref:Uncharacterized protein n=1 Tax=Araneus ventricosus TaxID=182803 RepID=A0A4Y2C2H7_ARAVE|nr:hypothetical protein AVEN_89771-1 [Araneus ventricosus]